MNNKHTCVVCMGSNFKPEAHLENAVVDLTRTFSHVVLGKSVKTKDEGGKSQSDYLNLAAEFQTELDPTSVIEILKKIERQNGRTASSKELGCVSLDIDLLSYDENRIKPEEFSKSYVKLALLTLHK